MDSLGPRGIPVRSTGLSCWDASVGPIMDSQLDELPDSLEAETQPPLISFGVAKPLTNQVKMVDVPK